MAEKVFVVTSEIISADDCNSSAEGVYRTIDGALRKTGEVVRMLCSTIYEEFEEWYNERDQYEGYAEEFEGYESLEEYWDDWVAGHFESQTYWTYSDEQDFEYRVEIMEMELED